MSGRTALAVSRLAVAAAVASGLAWAGGGCGDDEPDSGERGRAVAAAIDAYREAKASGVELEVGPCIAERLPGLDDWVADVAHDPRQDVDDESENQCRRYGAGEASHFVELTPGGGLIRAE